MSVSASLPVGLTEETAAAAPSLSSRALGLGWLAVAVTLLVACRSTFAKLLDLWNSNPDYSHGFLVPIFTLGYLFVHRKEIGEMSRQKQSWLVVASGLGLILAAGALHVVGVYSRALSVEGLSIPLLLSGIVLAALGKPGLKVLPAVLFLVFMAPVPGVLVNRIAESLQFVATNASTFVFQLCGIPALDNGIVIALPNTELRIAEACSGIRMLITFVAMVVGYCIVSRNSLLEKLLLVLSTLPLAVAANVMRICATGAAHEFAPSWGDFVHDAAGMFMIVAGLLLLMAELWLFARLFSPEAEFRDPFATVTGIPAHTHT